MQSADSPYLLILVLLVGAVGFGLALLGTAGCMTGRERVVSPARSDVTSMTDSTIASATSECEAFGCVP